MSQLPSKESAPGIRQSSIGQTCRVSWEACRVSGVCPACRTVIRLTSSGVLYNHGPRCSPCPGVGRHPLWITGQTLGETCHQPHRPSRQTWQLLTNPRYRVRDHHQPQIPHQIRYRSSIVFVPHLLRWLSGSQRMPAVVQHRSNSVFVIHHCRRVIGWICCWLKG